MKCNKEENMIYATKLVKEFLFKMSTLYTNENSYETFSNIFNEIEDYDLDVYIKYIENSKYEKKKILKFIDFCYFTIESLINNFDFIVAEKFLNKIKEKSLYFLDIIN